MVLLEIKRAGQRIWNLSLFLNRTGADSFTHIVEFGVKLLDGQQLPFFMELLRTDLDRSPL